MTLFNLCRGNRKSFTKMAQPGSQIDQCGQILNNLWQATCEYTFYRGYHNRWYFRHRSTRSVEEFLRPDWVRLYWWRSIGRFVWWNWWSDAQLIPRYFDKFFHNLSLPHFKVLGRLEQQRRFHLQQQHQYHQQPLLHWTSQRLQQAVMELISAVS